MSSERRPSFNAANNTCALPVRAWRRKRWCRNFRRRGKGIGTWWTLIVRRLPCTYKNPRVSRTAWKNSSGIELARSTANTALTEDQDQITGFSIVVRYVFHILVISVHTFRVGDGRVVSMLARRSRDAEFEPHKVQTLIRCRVA